MKGDCIAEGNTKTQTLVTLTESSVFGARFDSSVTGGNRGHHVYVVLSMTAVTGKICARFNCHMEIPDV